MKIHQNVNLKDFSWIKIGGPCKKVIDCETDEEFIQVIKELIKDHEEFEVLGWGANTLIADRGINKTIVRNKSNTIKIHDNIIDVKNSFLDLSESGLNQGSNLKHNAFKNENITSGYEYGDINYSEPDAKDIRVHLGAGVSLPYAINSLIDQGVTGLHMFAGIPGTIGASVYNNIHGGPRLLSEFIESVEFINESGELQSLTNSELDFDYDQSIFHKQFGIITSANLVLKLGDKDKSRAASIEWVRRKRTQPKNSLGSTFHNIDKDDQDRLGLPTSSTAYLIEHVLGLSGFRIGGIMVPEKTNPDEIQVNKNILINIGDGTAEEYIRVMKYIAKSAYERCGITLKSEIFFKGFYPDETDLLS